MFKWKSSQQTQEKATEYATRSDFQQIFTQDMAGLHLLAFLLTVDQRKAEQCFVAGLEDVVRANPVFRQWARSWSKRAIIKNAIKIMAPTPGQPATMTSGYSWNCDLFENGSDDATSTASARQQRRDLIAAVTQLAPLDRFVLVMTTLEGYSVKDCAILLNRPPQDVIAAKSQALQRLGSLQGTPAPTAPLSRILSFVSYLLATELF